MKTSADTRIVMADAPGILAAAAVLRAGGLVAFPTETVYGLGADATSDRAVAGIYAAKQRPAFNPLIAHVPDLAAALLQGAFSAEALALARAFWPGPLTLIVPSTGTVCALARAGLGSVALRVPGSLVARQLISALGRPLAGPSANRSGHVSPVSAAHVVADLAGRIDMVLDGGACPVGVESTIVACLDGQAQLLRPGGVTAEAIEALLGYRLARSGDATIVAPGQLASHYAPRAKLRLEATMVLPNEAVLDFANCLGSRASPGALVLDLSARGDLGEAAAALFGHLRRLDDLGAQAVAVATVPHRGLGAAINDRLARAAAVRPSGWGQD